MAYRANHDPDGPEKGPRSAAAPDLEDVINGAVRLGSGIGSSVLGSIADALDQVGERLDAMRGVDAQPPFAVWKRRLDNRLHQRCEENALALAVTGWVLAGCFGIAAFVMWALAAAGPQALGVSRSEFIVFPVLMACFTPLTVGFGIMGGIGVKKYRYAARLRRYLRVARDWVCDVDELAQNAAADPAQVRQDLAQAVARGDFPDALLQADGTLYLDLSRCAPTQASPEPQSEPQPQAQTEPEAFVEEGTVFLGYLRSCTGRLGADADEELAQMQKICAAIVSFVRNHPEQLPRVRRFREYYLPTTRKLLDTAQGLGETQAAHAQEIRRDITGILHTLNQAYGKLYDTLLQDISLDVSTEIGTLETMLRQDGLTHDFETDFKNG